MSTRRARIKAVAALPQRRKNADNADSKIKQDQKELAENVIKSPKVRRASVDKFSVISPAKVAPSPRKPSPRKSPRSIKRTPDLEKSLEWKVPTPTPVLLEKRSTPLRDKTDTNKTATCRADVFVSPQARASPLRRRSPVVKTPIIEVDIGLEKQITPHKRLIELQEDAHRNFKGSENRENTETLMQQNVGIPHNSEKATTDVYNSPNTPETADVMDGIVPLKQVSNAPKPIDLLKSEIISENAEVLFDPIVPLPSPTKVRQKLRPVPRLGPMRRNSIPGSASESEDESRRAFQGGSSTPVPSRQRHDSHTSHSTMSLPNRDVNRVRNDSICSSVSQMAPQTPAPGSPLKEKNVTKTRRIDVSRRMAAMRRRKESVQRDKLTMFDLIFYNPITNPIVPDQDEIKAKEATKKEEAQRKLESKKEEVSEDTNDSNTDSSAPVPQIKLGPNGEIMLDEQSLVIKQSEQRKLSDSVVHEGAWVSSTSRVYRKTARTAEWTDAETIRFYRALAALGTDFSLMVTLFPGRTRRDLKLKFKKEERVNLPQIDKALRSVAGWDADRLEIEFADERRLAAEKALALKERLKKEKKEEKERCQAMKERKVRQSKGSKALGTSILPSSLAKLNEGATANEILIQAANAKKRRELQKLNEKSIPITLSGGLPRNPDFATLTPIGRNSSRPKVAISRLPDMATLQRTKPGKSPSLKTMPHKSPVVLNALPAVPADIAPGSLVVLTVDDPKAPSQKAIHTYIKQGDGSIASIILDPNVMSSLVSYVKKDTPKAGSSSSTSTISPCSVASDRTNTPPVSASSSKRKRVSSYTITDL